MAPAFTNLKDKTLALFFTYGVSLDTWEKRGMLARELKIYQKLGERFGRIYFLTYGVDDGRFSERLHHFNIQVLPKKYRLPNFVYSLLLPFIYRRQLRQCDFYKTNQMAGSWSAVLAKWRYGKKLIARTGYTWSIFARRRGFIKYVFTRAAEWLTINSCDRLVVATDSEKEYFKNWSSKIAVIPNYVDTESFRPRPEPKHAAGPKAVLFVGRLAPEKNLTNLITAVSGLVNVKLCLAGDGERRAELERQARAQGVTAEFLGARPHAELPALINAADVFVLPSLYEGNPKALLEAMACGAVILAANSPGIAGLIESDVNGYLTGASAAELRFGLDYILNHPERWPVWRQNARQKIEQQYSLERVFDQELNNYA